MECIQSGIESVPGRYCCHKKGIDLYRSTHNREANLKKDGDAANAYRHAMWNALLTQQIGSINTKIWTDAHEAWPDEVMQKEHGGGFKRIDHTMMDYHNNEVGRSVVGWLENVSEQEISESIIEKLREGELIYIVDEGGMMSLLNVQLRNKSNRIKNILIVFLIFFSLWSELGFRLDKHDQRIIAEIERIEIYFRGTLIVSKIPPWVERAPVNTDVAKLQHLNYLLQDSERAERMEEDPWALDGMPYYPFVSREKALKCFHALTEEEKSKYIVVSCSIIYIRALKNSHKKTGVFQCPLLYWVSI